MNDGEPDSFETELRGLKPARPPDEFMARLAESQSPAQIKPGLQSRPRKPRGVWAPLLRWLTPAVAAAAILALFVWPLPRAGNKSSVHTAAAGSQSKSPGKDLEIDRQMVAAFEAVARLPSGEPVRFRFRKWTDDVVLRDSARGIEIEQRVPGFEVVPVRFETY